MSRCIVLCAVLAATVSTASATAESPFSTLPTRAEALLPTSFVLHVKMEGAPADREVEGETSCLMIDPAGLAICSNVELGGYVSMVSRMMHNPGLSASPSDLEVTIGGTEYPADLLARDSDRDLAWIRLRAAADKTFAYQDLAASSRLAVGDSFFVLRRMHEFFARAPIVSHGTIGAVVSRPRELFVPDGPMAGGFGLPVYDATGTFVGVTVLQMPGEDDATEGLMDSSFSFFGQSSRMQDMIGGLILPASEIEKATRLARESFPELPPAAAPSGR